jgi:AraC family transcriptional regulator
LEPKIETLEPKILVGKSMTMSLIHNKTPELWRSFVTSRAKIKNVCSADLFSVQIYHPGYFEQFDPANEFEKWATIEVKEVDSLPKSLKSLSLPGGLYAVFHYKGAANAGHDTFKYIFETWVPQSKYKLDDRPHFEQLGAKYKGNDPSSEEDIWIPITPK